MKATMVAARHQALTALAPNRRSSSCGAAGDDRQVLQRRRFATGSLLGTDREDFQLGRRRIKAAWNR